MRLLDAENRSTSDVTDRPAHWQRPAARSLSVVLFFALCGALLLLVVPYFLPVRPALSDSYLFGFNNRGAILLWLLFSLAFGVWHGPLQNQERVSADTGVSDRRPLWAMLTLAALLHTAAWIACNFYGPLQEALYCTDRLQHLASGERIFRDFEFAYGAGLLYLPLFLSRLLHLSLLNAYCCSLMIEQLAGIVLLWYVVKAASAHARRRYSIFLLLSLTCLAWVPLVAAQYTSLRYWFAPAVAVLVYDLAIVRHQRRLAWLCLVGGLLVTLLISPEQVVPLLGGVSLFSVLFLSRLWRWIFPGLLLFLLAAVTILWAAFRAGALETLITIGSGAYAVPIGPAPVLLPLLTLLLVAACVFVEAIRCRTSGTVTTLLLCLSPFSLSAAFGRFDPVHLIANTFTATLVAWVALSRNERWWRTVAAAYSVIVFVFPTQLPMVYRSDFKLIKTAPKRVKTFAAAEVPTFYSPLGPVPAAHPGAASRFNFQTGRFYGATDLITNHQMAELLNEMRAKGSAPMLMMHATCIVTSSAKALMLFNTGLYYPKPRHTNPTLKPLCNEIETNYQVIAHPSLTLPDGWYLVRRRPDAH